MTYAFFVNIGGLSSILTTLIEQRASFWAAFLLPLLVFLIGFTIVVTTRKHYVIQPPTGSIILNAFQVCWIALTHNWTLNAAKSSCSTSQSQVTWNDTFVDELRRLLMACRIFVFFPIYFLTYSQMQTNFISQAGTMETYGLPNDIIFNINPLTVLVFLPLLDRLVYPLLHRLLIPFYPITRITLGFILCSCSMAYAAVLQHIIYASPPCYRYPLSPNCLGGKVPNQVHVAWQIPAYVLLALSEVFLVPTGNEYIFTRAPASMKSFVMAIHLSTVSLGSLLAIAITPWVIDPKLTWVYAALAVGVLVAGLIFWSVFRGSDGREVEMTISGR